MELLDRYLEAVEYYLPRDKQNDIIHELSANILAEVEDKEAELGRPLNETEQEALIKKHGHPMLVASLYRRESLKCLIGPEQFPLYGYVLRIVLSVVALANVLAGGIAIWASDDHLGTFFTVWGILILTVSAGFGTVTAVFAAHDYFRTGFHFLENWSPRSLPRVNRDGRDVARGLSIAELILGSIGIIAFLMTLHWPFSTFGGSVPTLKLTPVWYTYEIPVLLAVLPGLAASVANAIPSHRQKLRMALRMTSDAIGIVTFSLFCRAGGFVVILDPAAQSREVKILNYSLTVAELTNYSVALGLLIFVVCFALDGVGEARRLVRRLRDRSIPNVSLTHSVS